MITVKEWMELVDYRITEGSDYCWSCFGDSAFSLSAWNGDQDGWSMNMVFDTKDQTVYTVEVCDYKRERAYRIINPNYKMVHDAEALSRGVDFKQAWDDVNYVDLETVEDFCQKAEAIRDDEDYDTRVSVPLNLPDDALFTLMMQAHEQDITFNEHIENIVRAACEEALADPEAYKRKMGINTEPYDDEFEQGMWDDLAEDDHWDDDILEDEAPKKKKKQKKSK